ncbi:MAG: hypothetical protein IJS97_03580 [Prevotella sp.]|nr:hypothetical protein [Prevotella sp.]
MMRESRDRVATYEQTDSVREQVMVAVHDTVMEVTTITVREAANGDTLRVSTVTDRVRGRSRDAIATQRTKTEVRVDTVYIEKRDSIEIRSRPSGPLKKGSNLVAILKWLFAIVVALIGLKVSPFLWRREKK